MVAVLLEAEAMEAVAREEAARVGVGVVEEGRNPRAVPVVEAVVATAGVATGKVRLVVEMVMGATPEGQVGVVRVWASGAVEVKSPRQVLAGVVAAVIAEVAMAEVEKAAGSTAGVAMVRAVRGVGSAAVVERAAGRAASHSAADCRSLRSPCQMHSRSIVNHCHHRRRCYPLRTGGGQRTRWCRRSPGKVAVVSSEVVGWAVGSLVAVAVECTVAAAGEDAEAVGREVEVTAAKGTECSPNRGRSHHSRCRASSLRTGNRCRHRRRCRLG